MSEQSCVDAGYCTCNEPWACTDPGANRWAKLARPITEQEAIRSLELKGYIVVKPDDIDRRVQEWVRVDTGFAPAHGRIKFAAEFEVDPRDASSASARPMVSVLDSFGRWRTAHPIDDVTVAEFIRGVLSSVESSSDTSE